MKRNNLKKIEATDMLRCKYIIEANPRKFYYTKDIAMTMSNHFGGYRVLFESKKGLLSAICLGDSHGLWEIMSSKPPKIWGDSVKGGLTFNEVLKWVKKQL